MDIKILDQQIIFEDEWLIVLNKPSGFVVNSAYTYKEPTVQDWMAERLSANFKFQIPNFKLDEHTSPEEVFAARQGIVHRLDKDTSGILLLAKKPDVLMELMRQFKARQVQKVYLALVHGKLEPVEGIINLPMDRSVTQRQRFAVRPDGRIAQTQYLRLEHFPGLPAGISARKGKSYQGFSLAQISPKTGRTHQIRVHMSAIGHPVVGDQFYAGKKRAALDAEWCKRLFLHAQKITFTHPVTKSRVTFEAPLPSELQEVLERLI